MRRAAAKRCDVHVTQAQPEQALLLDEAQDLVIARHDDPIKLPQNVQHHVARSEIADRQLSDNEGMRHNLPTIEQICQHLIARRRWSIHTELSTSITPPSIGAGAQVSDRVAILPIWPRRRAASRWTRAWSAALTSADFS